MQNYKNVETKIHANGGKTVRTVIINGDQGHKTVTKYSGGKKIFSVKKPIDKGHILRIKGGRFIKGLFKDCVKCNRTRKL